jgi:hypothetical protein
MARVGRKMRSVMRRNRRFFLLAASLSVALLSRPGWAIEAKPWDGNWSGSLGKVWPVVVTIKDGKVVQYLYGGAPVAIAYQKMSDSKVSFGDREHYAMTMTKTGEETATANFHGRHGDVKADLTRK